MRFTLTINSDNATCTDMNDLVFILAKVLGRVEGIRNNGGDIFDLYDVKDANGNTVGSFTGEVPAMDYEDEYLPEWDERDPFRDDVEADADVLAGIGWGTDEDYGYYGDDDY